MWWCPISVWSFKAIAAVVCEKKPCKQNLNQSCDANAQVTVVELKRSYEKLRTPFFFKSGSDKAWMYVS